MGLNAQGICTRVSSRSRAIRVSQNQMKFCLFLCKMSCCLVVFNTFLFARLFCDRISYVFLPLGGFADGRPCKNDKKARSVKTKKKKTRSGDVQVRPRLLVIFACAASRWPSQKQKCTRNSVTAKAKKTDMCENNKKVRIGSPFFSKSHKAFGHEHRKSRIETGCKISCAFTPIYFRNVVGGQTSVFWTPLKSRNPHEGEDLRILRFSKNTRKGGKWVATRITQNIKIQKEMRHFAFFNKNIFIFHKSAFCPIP